MKCTVLIENKLLGSSRYRGTFEDEGEAIAYAVLEASRTRKFVSYEVWTGTPERPGKPTKARFVGEK